MPTSFDSHANNAETTLNSDLSASQASCIVRSASDFPSPSFNATIWDGVTYPDPTDDPSMEIVRVTAGPSTSKNWSITRAQESTTAVAHDSGSKIALLFTAKLLTDVEDAINSGSAPGHTHTTTDISDITSTYAELNILDGVTSTAAELNILDGVKVTAAELNILDGVTADKDEINFLDTATAGTAVASKAVVLNATKDFNFGTGDITATDITASGDVITDEIKASTADTPIKVSNGTHSVPATYTPAGAATATLDVSNSNLHSITMPAGNITIAISNETVGQFFVIEITQDAVGSRTVTWFSTIKWADGSAPTLTTTADKKDTFGFRVTAADKYDGFVVGQNI